MTFPCSVSSGASLQLYLEIPCPCFSSSTVYSSLILAKGMWGPYSLPKCLMLWQKDQSRGRILHPVFSCAIVTANCSQYPNFLWHVVNGRTALLFRFELELKCVRLVESLCKIALQCPQKKTGIFTRAPDLSLYLFEGTLDTL